MTKLPSWLNELLPEDRPLQTLSYDASRKLFLVERDNKKLEYEDIASAHEAINEVDYDLIADQSAVKQLGGRRGFLTYKTDDGNYGVILDHTDEDRRRGLETNFEDFLNVAKTYHDDPHDFLKSWNYINDHPVFWTRLKDSFWHWETTGYLTNHAHFGVWEDEGKVLYSIDAGGHVEGSLDHVEPYVTHYADWRLEVVDISFEKAVIQLAERVAICFHDDGTDRENAKEILERVKPQWVTDLEQRLNDAKPSD